MMFYSPGPELDRAIVEQVFGWEASEDGTTYSDPLSASKDSAPLPPFSKDDAAAELVRQRVDSRGGWQWGPLGYIGNPAEKKQTFQYLLRHPSVSGGEWIEGRAANSATALCQAVMKAIAAGAEFRPRPAK